MPRPEAGDAIHFTWYALARLALRKLSREEIESVIKHPLTITPSTLDPTGSVLTQTVGGRKISVVVAPVGDRWFVITAWEAD